MLRRMKSNPSLYVSVAQIALTPVIGLAILLSVKVAPGYADSDEHARRVSPQLRIQHRFDRGRKDHRPSEKPYRTIDGSGNNRDNPDWGAAHIQLLRLVPSDYADGISMLAGPNRPGPRDISNAVVDQPRLSISNTLGASDYLWQWGQFLDHDISLTDGTDPPEPENIPIPKGDPFFDPDGSGDEVFEFNRSIYDTATGTGAGNPRQQLNEITAFVDASNVYGSDEERASALRTNDGTGKLKTSAGELLPFNTFDPPLPNAGGTSPSLFVAGDVRANEQVGLTAMHTLFVREHNRLAEEIAAADHRLSGNEIYERARKIVGAEIQVITYREFLPALMGRGVLSHYHGYIPQANPGIGNLFSTATFRLGHSLLSPTLLRLDADGSEIPEGHLSLSDAFFAPQRIIDEGGIEPLLRGLAAQPCQALDPFIVDDVRNFLFANVGTAFDLASLNIQRGRDHGLPSYNDTREAFGLRRARNFRDVSSSQYIQKRLASVYKDVEDIDLWVGALSEDPVRGGHVGPLIRATLKRQFEALRDGDRFWYEQTFSRREIQELEKTKLSDIIRRNTTIGNEIPDNVFSVRGTRQHQVVPHHPGK
jgi:peroxidase